MAELAGFFVQIYTGDNTSDGWETMLLADDKHVAALVATSLEEQWDVEARFITPHSLRKEARTVARVKEAEEELKNLEADSRAQVAAIVREVTDAAVSALDEVKASKLAIAQAERDFNSAVTLATDAGYSLREIGKAAGLSQTRIYQLLKDQQKVGVQVA